MQHSRPNELSVALCVVGLKGAHFLEGVLAAGVMPAQVFSYPQSGDGSGSFDTIRDLASCANVAFEESRRPDLAGFDLVFLVGWQFLVRDPGPHLIVFHDSLLPAMRGFSPTVSALINGDILGVTALQPDAGVDTGPVYAQRALEIGRSCSIESAFDQIARLMVEIAVDLVEQAREGTLVATAQPADGASYSLWRDGFDYFIDWRDDAEKIARFVDAVGAPYQGAQAILASGEVLIVRRATPGPHLAFVNRDPGKVWKISDGRALVVCGKGTLWLDHATDRAGETIQFRKLRTRFLTADTAWLRQYASNG